MEYDRVRVLEAVDRHPALRTFAEQALGGVEARQVVEQARGPGLRGIGAVDAGEAHRGAGDVQDVDVAVTLADVLAHAPRRPHEVDAGGDQWRNSRKMLAATSRPASRAGS